MDGFLKLAVAEGCGQHLIAALLDPCTPASELLRAPDDLPPRVRQRLLDPTLAERARGLVCAAQRCGLALLTPAHDRYPRRLRHAPLRPLALFARGHLDALDSERAITVVGSRSPTPYGMAAAEDFTAALARADFAVWSGLAVGIDGIAHRTALAHDARTVAVLAGGLDTIYPCEHERMATRIAERGGVLLSEAPPGRRARRGHFPRRNRILACAADAVLVVEAGATSGSLHTARFAAEAGVPVFAVPGPYTSHRSAGCHALIADGAQIASDPADLLRRLGVEAALAAGADAECFARSADETAILAALDGGPRPSDLVRRETNLSEARYLAALLALTKDRSVIPLPGDLIARAQGSRKATR